MRLQMRVVCHGEYAQSVAAADSLFGKMLELARLRRGRVYWLSAGKVGVTKAECGKDLK